MVSCLYTEELKMAQSDCFLLCRKIVFYGNDHLSQIFFCSISPACLSLVYRNC